MPQAHCLLIEEKKMKYQYDMIVIGLGPAGMALSVMGAEMGLKVLGIEKHKIGGECMNVGCIPSKAVLQIAKIAHSSKRLSEYSLGENFTPKVGNIFKNIQNSLDYIGEAKTLKMFDKVTLLLGKGGAEFVDRHTVRVGTTDYSAKKIFIATGTRPAVPKFEGVNDIDYLTNENIFSLDKVPESMLVVGGGAIACEMAQGFNRLGCKVSMIIRGPKLLWREDHDAVDVLEKVLTNEGIRIYRKDSPKSIRMEGDKTVIETENGETIEVEKLLLAAGRSYDHTPLKLENAGIKLNESGAIAVNKHLRTSTKGIYACGDCNGFALFSHAAMHQGMVALMNSMMPFKMNYKKFLVPWTVFTEPQFSHVGPTKTELDKKGVKYEEITIPYDGYGAAIAEKLEDGFVRVLCSTTGRVYSATIIGEGSGEMINEWCTIIQNKIRMHKILFQQHSFPTMGFLSKRIAETWTMNRMQPSIIKRLATIAFRLFN